MTALDAHDWADGFNPSNTPPLADDWDKHPFWADKETLANPETAAGKAILDMQQECTPQERAESCKDRGNETLKQGLKIGKKLLIREAVERYSEGLNILEQAGFPPDSATLRCALYSNRAHASGLIRNWRSALNDARWALKVDPSHMKSHFRAANAAMQLRLWKDALEHCARGLEREPGAPELLKVQKECLNQARAAEEREAAEAAAEAARLAPFRAVARALCERGYRMTRPQLEGPGGRQEGARFPWLDADGALHFPVLLFYPEASPYHDVIADFEEGQCFRDHLDQVFSSEAGPLPWDDQREYTRERVQLYYCGHAGRVLKEGQVVDALQGRWPERFEDDGPQRYGPKAARMRRVHEDLTLKDILRREDHVMPGVPTFWVVSENTVYAEQFLGTWLSTGE